MADYLPTQSDDAQRAQLIQRLFMTAGDLFAGTDTTLRIDPNQFRADGSLGPAGSAVSYGVGDGGEIYVRGSTGQVGTTRIVGGGGGGGGAVAGLTITPGLLMLLAVGYLLLKR